MIIHPGHLNRRSEFYRQVGQMLESGLPILQALEVMRRHSMGGDLGRGVEVLRQRLGQGETLGRSVDMAGDRAFPPFDAALLRAGEASGRLPECLAKLGLYYEERARLLRQMIMWTVYPMIIIHMILFIFPIEALQGLVIRGEVGPFLTQKLIFLMPLYAGLLALTYLMQGHRASWIRGTFEQILWRLPLAGKAARSMAMSRLCLDLESMLSAGMQIVEAWEHAGPASGSFILGRAAGRMRAAVDRGVTPAEVVMRSTEFPAEFCQQYYSAEMSGKLDVTLARMQKLFEEQGLRQSKVAVTAVAGMLYGGALIWGAVMVLRFWLGYFGRAFEAIQ